MCFIWTRAENGDVGFPAYRHGSDIQGLWGVHLAELPEGFSPASPTYTLLVLPLPILDQTPTNCTKKEETVGINSVSEKLQHLLNLCYSLLIMYFFNKVGENVLVFIVSQRWRDALNICRTQRSWVLDSDWSITNIQPCLILKRAPLLDCSHTAMWILGREHVERLLGGGGGGGENRQQVLMAMMAGAESAPDHLC